MKRVLISILARVKGNVNANGTIAALTEIKKFFTTEGETRVYVSGRCVKNCIKQRLEEKGLPMSLVSRVRRVLQPKGDPIEYIDDDLFGYLIPQEERKRFASIKTDGIVALRHCEITRDFGARFDLKGVEDPSPFEVEVADFIGQNNWILTENIGRFEEKELTKEIINASPIELVREANENNVYSLPPNDRKDRIKGFLEILLKERYTFPRSATSLHQPHYYYAVILPTNRLLPLFASIDYEIKDGKVLLDINKIEDLSVLLNTGEKIAIIDFENALGEELKLKGKEYEETLKRLEEEFKKSPDNEKLNESVEELKNKIKGLSSIEIIKPQKMDKEIDEISKFLFGA